MRLAAILLSILNGALALPQIYQPPGCTPLPDLGITLGDPVPIDPSAIPAGCNDFEVLVARGTSELSYPTFGIVVGDPVISNLTLRFPRARGYPVQYPASSSLTSVSTGTTDVVSRLMSQSTNCPSQRFALVGYSQGAQVMHNAAIQLSSTIQSKILALAMFGDPQLKTPLLIPAFPAALQSDLIESCADGDEVCDPTGVCFYPHLTYIEPYWINRTVDFLIEKFSA